MFKIIRTTIIIEVEARVTSIKSHPSIRKVLNKEAVAKVARAVIKETKVVIDKVETKAAKVDKVVAKEVLTQRRNSKRITTITIITIIDNESIIVKESKKTKEIDIFLSYRVYYTCCFTIKM